VVDLGGVGARDEGGSAGDELFHRVYGLVDGDRARPPANRIIVRWEYGRRMSSSRQRES
jgi:hypothetical protein